MQADAGLVGEYAFHHPSGNIIPRGHVTKAIEDMPEGADIPSAAVLSKNLFPIHHVRYGLQGVSILARSPHIFLTSALACP